MPSFAPHTDEEIQQMLADLGMSSLQELYSSIPAALLRTEPLAVAKDQSEIEVLEQFVQYGAQNAAVRTALVSFAGGGAYDHDLSAAARHLGTQSAFVTAYTPYQPEVAQGVLQALFEFQTIIARLFGLPIANASLYDGAASLVEAVNMAVGFTKERHILVSAGVNPAYREALATFGAGTRLSFETIELGAGDATSFPFTDDGTDDTKAGAVIVGYPNYFGAIEDLKAARALADRHGALLIVVADPIALGLLRSPGEFGADIVVGEGQPLGIPLSFGGPYLGLFAARSEYVRLMPGRLVGETLDTEGRRAFVTTLRTREQDIRREKATSNVCTNQTLMAIQAAIHMAWLGKQGFGILARRNYDGAHYLAERLNEIGLAPSTTHFFREFTVRTPISASELAHRLLTHGFLAGVIPPGFDDRLVIAVTEARRRVEIDSFVDTIAKELR
ncbi:aminomethyl-transferring glycine dehydrogenase subunit GcvPA [Ferrimicrobium sp.]|uniref:aminomethyl-transferring glycine dehydrogenase subunit GcvPA n=1 Tax=Ferrimicrobium sp. TaxID=2926050 RepID=UPI002609A21C|nr:aminomethyl-transferring glycine dehydrogenase subunit GcvPA [Ferrimicrobium sp.]